MRLFKIITVVVFSLIGLSNLEAQNNDALPKGLTKEQIGFIQAQKDLITANREAFKVTLTAAQQAILANPKLNAKQQQEALLSSLTNEQKLFLTDSKVRMQQLKEAFRNSFSEEQRQQVRLLNGRKIRESVQESKNHVPRRK